MQRQQYLEAGINNFIIFYVCVLHNLLTIYIFIYKHVYINQYKERSLEMRYLLSNIS